MTDNHRGWTYVRNITAVLSLVNVLSVYAEKTVVGSSSIRAVLDDPDSRVRFWATAVLLLFTGLLALLHLVVSTRDVATDLHPKAAVRRLVTLCFGGGQLVVAAFITLVLLATG